VKSFFVLLTALVLTAAAVPVTAHGAGVRWLVVDDPRPSVVSPLGITIGDAQGGTSVMEEVRLEVQGFGDRPR
jgi:hypothetical protein